MRGRDPRARRERQIPKGVENDLWHSTCRFLTPPVPMRNRQVLEDPTREHPGRWYDLFTGIGSVPPDRRIHERPPPRGQRPTASPQEPETDVASAKVITSAGTHNRAHMDQEMGQVGSRTYTSPPNARSPSAAAPRGFLGLLVAGARFELTTFRL